MFRFSVLRVSCIRGMSYLSLEELLLGIRLLLRLARLLLLLLLLVDSTSVRG